MAYVTKSFSTATIPAGGKVELTFTLVNDDVGDITGITFEDVFPFGMTIANPNELRNLSGLSGIGATPDDDVVSVTDASLAGGEIVIFSLKVVLANPGVYVNETGLITTNEDGEIPDSSGIASISALRSGSRSQWGLMRFDIKTRGEEVV